MRKLDTVRHNLQYYVLISASKQTVDRGIELIVIMPGIIAIFLLAFIGVPFGSCGQEKALDQVAADKERLAFENTLDSLFLANNFTEIIDRCSQPHSDYLNRACTFNLIGAYYFSGDSATCRRLLNKEIATIRSYADADAYSLEGLLHSDYAAYKKFLINSTVKNYILDLIDSTYMAGHFSDKKNGMELLHLLIEDQWIRNTSSLYDHLKPEKRHLLPARMDSTQAMQAQYDHCVKVFNFYKARNKVFSMAEVGRIYYWQLMLFFHDQDLSRRSFYHELVKQGVKDGVLDIENQMNFEAGTELIKMGIEDFFLHREEIQEALRKKYSRPGFRIRLM